MVFNVEGEVFTAVKARTGSIQTAHILGTVEKDGARVHYLDRHIIVLNGAVPKGWSVSGVVSSVVTEIEAD